MTGPKTATLSGINKPRSCQYLLAKAAARTYTVQMSSISRIPPPADGAPEGFPAHLPARAKGRGALSNRDSRYLPTRVELDGDPDAFPEPALATECRPETAKSIIARNSSPDVPFDQSINPYRGCEHGCVYCYARPTHAWLDLSPGLDFETRLTWKANAAEQLEIELQAPGYRCKPITIGANTDPYQPVEKRHRVTRRLLEVALRYRHPVSLITKGNLVLRDIGILEELAAQGLATVAVSVTTLDRGLKRAMEPRTPAGSARLAVIEQLASAGIPVSVLVAPVIPALNDSELETILGRAADAGATSAAYILLRLPLEIRELFEEWLAQHYPLRAEHVMSLVRQSRGGRDYDTRFGHRMRGTGHFADLLSRRFQLACKRFGLNQRDERQVLDCSKFRVPPQSNQQLSLL
jgi:DNA repair photolyase